LNGGCGGGQSPTGSCPVDRLQSLSRQSCRHVHSNPALEKIEI
jgi:hypothetical protein